MKWYLHRLRAMSLQEMLLHARKKARHAYDRLREPICKITWNERPDSFPCLPTSSPPSAFLDELQRETESILSGRINAWGWLTLVLDDPPNWHKDYFAQVDCRTNKRAADLNHRALPGGADVKLIWELSRWNYLVRLAQAAAFLNNPRAGEMCVRHLRDWEENNPLLFGWNWTSALEAGLRLVQLAWISALLERAGLRQSCESCLGRLAAENAYLTARFRSFGSSANNHLIGELAGLIVAVARWPELTRLTFPLHELQTAWEHEVLAQFAEDGGNREQALNYHLFSFEFCWQARLALLAAGMTIRPAVEERLRLAADFFRVVQAPHEPWDNGDSDSAYVTPLFASNARVTQEWIAWLRNEQEGETIAWWLGPAPASIAPKVVCWEWQWHPSSGVAIAQTGAWRVRWDLSPLGYLSTAAHGHLDALHLTIWFQNKAFIIDPGTGAYYGNKEVRQLLADWRAHNGPVPDWGEWPKRMGPFLWKEHHPQPEFNGAEGRLRWPKGVVKRRTELKALGLIVEDSIEGPEAQFEVNWHFAPGTSVVEIKPKLYQAEREGVSIYVRIESDCQNARLILPPTNPPGWDAFTGTADLDKEEWKRTLCSPAFRQLAYGPKLVVTAGGLRPCVLRTAFLTSLD